MKIPDNVKTAFINALKARRVVVGSCSKDCVPNAVPIGIAEIHGDETVVIVDNYFLKTRKNMEENPIIAISFWDMEEKDGKLKTKEGYQVKGKATIQTKGDLYERIKASNAKLPVNAIALIKVDEIFDVKAGPNAGKMIQ